MTEKQRVDKIEAEILKLRLDTERRFNATMKLLQIGAKVLVGIEKKVDALVVPKPANGHKKKGS